jgi:hypothetical protein
MSPRLHQLASDWKTYLGLLTLLAASTEAVANLYTQLAKDVPWLAQVGPHGRWVAVGVLALVAVFSLRAALARRSALLRPERFVVSADDPGQLVGREEEVIELADTCEQHTLVFLLGASGAGKTALVHAGLTPYCHRPRVAGETRRLRVLSIDASSLGTRGLSDELARVLHTLTRHQLAELGGGSPPPADEVFSWLAALPSHAPRQLLIVLDQFDDHVAAHRDRFVRGRTVVSPAELESTNQDWASVAVLLRTGHVRLLVVCRDDAAAALDAVRFVRPATFILPSMDRQLISPLIENVTKEDGRGEVIADPEFGWTQLKARLLHDLSSGGRILPIQLVVSLASLRRCRFLTPREYARLGGAPGLERLHIERHLRDAAAIGGVHENTLLRGLARFVTEDGTKAQRGTVTEFVTATLGGAATGRDLTTALEHLERSQILRRQTDGGTEYLVLHHDYLARGVREAARRANRWIESLRERDRLLAEAFTLRQRWQALIPVTEQASLAWARLRGRFTYGPYRRLALWSALRLLTVALALATALSAASLIDRDRERRQAERLLAAIDTRETPGLYELENWVRLSALADHARFYAVRYVLADPSLAIRAIPRGDVLVHSVIGLDPDLDLGRAVLSQVLPVVASRPSDSPTGPVIGALDAGLAVLANLRLGPREANAAGIELIARMQMESNVFVIENLGAALVRLAGKIDGHELLPAADDLVARIQKEQNSVSIQRLGRPLRGLTSRLEPADVRRLAQLLVARMTVEMDPNVLKALAETVAGMGATLKTDDVRPAAAALLTRMKMESRAYAFDTLAGAMITLSPRVPAEDLRLAAAEIVARGMRYPISPLERDPSPLGRLIVHLDASDVQALAAGVMARIQAERDSGILATLGAALGDVTGTLAARDAQPLAVQLTALMEAEQSATALATLGDALGALSAKLEPQAIAPAAAVLVARITREQDSRTSDRLQTAAARLSARLESAQASPLVRQLAAEMQITQDSETLGRLAWTLAELSANLDSRDAERVAPVLLARIHVERNRTVIRQLGVALAAVAARLNREGVRRTAAALSDRMSAEQNPYYLADYATAMSELAPLLESQEIAAPMSTLLARMTTERNGTVVGRLTASFRRLSTKLDPSAARPLAADLSARLPSEPDSVIAGHLAVALSSVAAKLPAEDARAAASSVWARMKTAREVFVVAQLGAALGDFSGSLERGVVRPIAAELVRRMETEQNSYALVQLGNTLARLGAKLEPEDVRRGAVAIASRMRIATAGTDGLAQAWVSLSSSAHRGLDQRARVQAYVEILQLPLMVGKARSVILTGLENALGNGQRFENDLWNFVDWATSTTEGRALGLNLTHRPYR